MTNRSSDAPSGPVLVSACLAGRACRFDATYSEDDLVSRLVAEGRAVLICPEVEGGLSTPRPPAEIVGGTGDDVLDGRARVMTRDGTDVTAVYIAGAERTLAAAREAGAARAILKSRSPSCGTAAIYDGSFTKTLRSGEGVTSALLRRAGIEVLDDEGAGSIGLFE